MLQNCAARWFGYFGSVESFSVIYQGGLRLGDEYIYTVTWVSTWPELFIIISDSSLIKVLNEPSWARAM